VEDHRQSEIKIERQIEIYNQTESLILETMEFIFLRILEDNKTLHELSNLRDNISKIDIP
jgi:hypothetical protein